MPIKILLEPINTHRKINKHGYREGFRELLQGEGREIFRYFEVTARGFRHHRIYITQDGPTAVRGGDMSVAAGVLEDIADNKIYAYVNWGTGPRIIRVRVAKLLVFMRNYSPATRPGSLQTGYYSRDLPWVRRKQVFHSTEARRFDKVIQHVMQGSIKGESRRKLAKLAKKTWI
jgi:hypothetical protein